MEIQHETLRAQYSLVQSSREELLKYSSKMPPEDLLRSESPFGRGGSIRNLLVHIVNVYEIWIGRNALGKDFRYAAYESYSEIQSIVPLFKAVDSLTDEFLQTFKAEHMISFELNSKRNYVTALTVFTHVITHEFHHKGQILLLSRHLGYIPEDTDIIRWS